MKQDLINRIEKVLSDQNADERETLIQLKNILFEVELMNCVSRESTSISCLISETLNQLKDGKKDDNVIKTGFSDFDNLFGGFSYGELVVIGGRPSMGKTQLLVNLALNVSRSNPLLYFTFDLSEFLLTNRFISSVSNIAVNKLLQHDLREEEKIILAGIESSFNENNIFINDSSNNSMSAFKAHCKKHIEENGVKIIIVDYLQMMSSNKYRNNRELEVSYISRELKNIAKDNKVCVIATSQLSRSVETRGGYKRPLLSDLRESGAIEQDADKVIFIYRPEYYGFDTDDDGNNVAGVTELILAKNRNGILGSVKLKRNANFTNYIEFDGYTDDFNFSESRLNEIDNPF